VKNLFTESARAAAQIVALWTYRRVAHRSLIVVLALYCFPGPIPTHQQSCILFRLGVASVNFTLTVNHWVIATDSEVVGSHICSRSNKRVTANG
jgi:hypothetical protein